MTSEDLLHLPQRASEFDATLRAKLDDIVARATRKPPDRIDIVSYVLIKAAIPAARDRADAVRGYLIAAGLDSTRTHADVRQVMKLREHGMGLAVRKGAEITLTHEAGPRQGPSRADTPAYTLNLIDVPLKWQDYPAATVSMLDALADTIRACGSASVDISTHAAMFEEMGNPRAQAVKAYLIGRDVPADSIRVSERSALRYGSSEGVMGKGRVMIVSVEQEPPADLVPKVRSRVRSPTSTQGVLPAYA
ncbi:hypothetical protein ASB57_15200 [Bordetella sp. N]|nr:hypothetical protein ASB57_15200 [Bordetella sp. N]